MHKILLRLVGGAAFAAYPGFAAGQTCINVGAYRPNIDSLYSIWVDTHEMNSLPHNFITHSYKATGKIEFLAPCPDSDKLCKTGAYIDAGDYFLAVPQKGDYYCAVYMPDSETSPKIVSLIKNENFIETPEDDYKALKGVWQSKAHGIKKTIGFYKFRGDTFISMTGDATYLDQRRAMTDPVPLLDFYRTIVLKTGPDSFISNNSNLKLQAGKLKLTDPRCSGNSASLKCPSSPDFDFSLSATYTYLAPSTLSSNLFK